MEITCPICHSRFTIINAESKGSPKFCVYCQNPICPTPSTKDDSISIIKEHLPEPNTIQFRLGPYQIIDSIGKGGMGEVFLAYDTTCGRRLALKRIRPDLLTHHQLHDRFIKEALITSQLTHPAIIPIYTIQNDQDLAYYTMPFVEGQTLKQILSHAKKQERKGIKPDHASSIPTLIRYFLSVCQAVAYAHSKKVIHRDLKPTNIIVGRYGEVLILDWGLAKLYSPTDQSEDVTDELASAESQSHEITHLGKVVGTTAYMAPERAFGHSATYQTDIYSLGVILYQILTLRHPFNRRSLQEFRKKAANEVLVPPAEVAPYRDVAPVLSRIALKCLSPSLEERYHTMDELINDLESYIEGRSDWFQIAELDVNRKKDWEFQENVLFTEHMAITRSTDVSDWVCLMISKASFADNIKIEANVRIGDHGHGVGFLLSVPEKAERTHLNNGYCLWLGSDLNKTTKMLRSTVEVIYAPEVFLQRDICYQVRIEKIDNNIYLYLNDTLQFSYISHLPLSGTHIGLLSRDADFSISDFVVYVGSQNIKVNCLAIPDAFLAHKNYTAALSEYRRIGYSFPGTAEGREAMFRAGITLLEEAKICGDLEESQRKREEALEEFSKMHGTPGAPLEYLGKALVYQSLTDHEEEIKCFELALRRYPSHPLAPVLHEQLIYRMHDSSRYHRRATYEFILLAVRYLPPATLSYNAKKLFDSLKRHWELLYFIDLEDQSSMPESIHNTTFAIQLAFWLAKPYVLAEIIDELVHKDLISLPAIGNALFALIELGDWKQAREKLMSVKEQLKTESHLLDLIEFAIKCHEDPCQVDINRLFLTQKLTKNEIRVILHLMEEALRLGEPKRVHDLTQQLKNFLIHPEDQLRVDCCCIWAYLAEMNWPAAEEVLHHYSLEQLTHEGTYLHFLYGCWLYVSEGKDIAFIHFASIFEVAYPRSWTLFSHFVNGKPGTKQLWLQKAFMWEKRQLYSQFELFYHCAGDEERSRHYRDLAALERCT